MAKSIDPFARKKAPAAPPPADPAAQKDRLARAAGAPRPATPPPARPVPGVTGNPPLPTGKVVSTPAVADLTPAEREALAAVGWTPEDGLPTTAEGLKELQQHVAKHLSAEVPLPVPMDTPPVRPTPVPLSTLPPARQQQFKTALAGITGKEEKARAVAAAQQTAVSREAAIPGITAAAAASAAAVRAFEERMAREMAVEAGPAPAQAPEQVAVNPAAVEAMAVHSHFAQRAEAAAPPAAPQPPQPPPETGANAQLAVCPHCSWDLTQADPVEPTYGDKMSFLQCMLGGVPYTKEYRLFGGTLAVKFRTLTMRELDLVYLQTAADKMPTEIDYYERLNRYRFGLQLGLVRSDGPGGFVHDLPDGYSHAANQSATGVWVTAEQEAAMSPQETGLPHVIDYVITDVLKTEAVFRVLHNTCSEFNRLVAKLEAMADNSDFWKPTGEQS